MQHPVDGSGGGARDAHALASLTTQHVVWYRAINRQQWSALIASNLGWLFDSHEPYALIRTVGALGRASRRDRV